MAIFELTAVIQLRRAACPPGHQLVHPEMEGVGLDLGELVVIGYLAISYLGSL